MAGLLYLGASRPAFAPGPKTLTFGAVAGVAEGDVLLLVVAYVNADSYALPAGWTAAAHLVGTSVTLDALVHTVGDNDPASVVLALTLATSEWQGELVALRGTSAAALVEASAIGNYVAAATPNAPAVSTQQAVSLELCAWSTTGANVPVPPAGFTVIDGYASALATSRSFGVGFAIANATGALPTRGATGANPSTGSALSLVLRDHVPVVPAALADPVPGNIGLRALAQTNIALRFDVPATALVADSIDNLDNLTTDDASTSAPTLVTAWTGFGRAFDPTASPASALIAIDLPKGNTLLQRDVTIRAILALELAAAAGATMTLIARGIDDGSPAEPYCYGLELQEQAGHAGFVEARWLWEDSAGTLRVQAAGVFQSPGDGVFFALAATRRWESTGKVVIRYYAGGQLAGELVSTNGDIAGGTTGHTTIGGRKHAGGWSHFFSGTIDELLVDALEVSGEELAQEHDRLTVHQPAGVDMFAGLMPPGAPWNNDPGNRIGRRVKIAGQALGQPIAFVEMMRALWLPDRAPLEQVIRWEGICGLVPKPRDSLDTRRARLVGYLSREEGFSRPAIQAALAELLDLAAASIEIVEYSNKISDSFDTIELERWLVAADAGAWSIVGGTLKLAVPATSDFRWEPGRVQIALRTPLSAHDGVVFAQLKLVTYWAALPSHTTVGLWLYNRKTNNAVWFGVNGGAAGARKIGYAIFANNVMGAFVPLANSPDAPVWIRVSRASADVAGHMTFGYSVVGPSTGFATVGIDTGVTDSDWAGVGATGTDVSSDADLAATFDDFFVWSPNGDRPFYWYVFRDPGLPGAPDLASADLVTQRIAPAHTYGRAIASKSVIAGDPLYGLAGYGPAGAV